MQEMPKKKRGISSAKAADPASWEEDQRKHEYYYDDAHGYEVYVPGQETIDEHRKTHRNMTKTNRIIYWIATVWLALGMTSSAIVQLIGMPEGVDAVTRLGYPVYLLTILGVWKILGVVAVLIPKFPRLKEWAYAGFFFVMSGAAISHIISGDPIGEIFPSLLLLVLTVVSWYFRPEHRRIATQSSTK